MANPNVESNTKTNCNDSAPAKEEGLGQVFTQQVIDFFGPKTDPRLREVMASFVQHMHDYARETQLTVDEWMAAVKMINWAEKMSNDRRNEGQLMCDVIGLESLVDDITHRAAAKEAASGTATAILWPFWRADTPIRENGTYISFETPENGVVAYLYGTVTSAETGNPIPNASVEDEKQREHNLCGKFITDAEGRFSFYCLRPTPYPVSDDGPAGKLLQLLDRHVYRPAHLHFMLLSRATSL
ncbi:hypothetical protein IL306_007971 [Fusarium sp. DS 682]|nr:hypothetical protein IL306_007971 [Fusarium sp. DS 682]